MGGSGSGSGSGLGLGSVSSYSREKSREERLVKTIVTSGGIRLQPTRDALQVSLTEALKLDALAISHALEAKLQSHMWQVCVRVLCVLEEILRKKDDGHFFVVASYFTENTDVVLKCYESPQASVREKANKVLNILGGEQSGSRMSQPDNNLKTEKPVIQMPNLIDTNDPNENENPIRTSDENNASLSTSTTSLMDDFFNDGDVHNNQPVNNDDPFAVVSFHGQNNKEEHESVDIFSGMATVDKPSGNQPELFDIFGSNDIVNDLMAGLSINENELSPSQNGASNMGSVETIFSDSSNNLNSQRNMHQYQAHGMTQNPIFPMDPNTFNAMMFNPMAFGFQPMNYAVMRNLLAHQQLLSTMSNNLHFHNTSSASSSSAFPDIFNPVIASQAPTSTMNSSKNDDYKAFDFISVLQDHLSEARDPNRIN